MNPIKKSDNSVSNIWTVQENLIHFYKTVALGFASFALVILAFTVTVYFRNPMIVVRSGTEQEFYATERGEAKIGRRDIEHFVTGYLRALYIWESFDPQKLGQEVQPLSEDALVPKILETQTQKFGKVRDKKISQDISFVRVKVLQDRVSCSFVRILKVDGIPLVVPTELELTLVEGSRTRVNPMGIYVAGITESENAK